MLEEDLNELEEGIDDDFDSIEDEEEEEAGGAGRKNEEEDLGAAGFEEELY